MQNIGKKSFYFSSLDPQTEIQFQKPEFKGTLYVFQKSEYSTRRYFDFKDESIFFTDGVVSNQMKTKYFVFFLFLHIIKKNPYSKILLTLCTGSQKVLRRV